MENMNKPEPSVPEQSPKTVPSSQPSSPMDESQISFPTKGPEMLDAMEDVIETGPQQSSQEAQPTDAVKARKRRTSLESNLALEIDGLREQATVQKEMIDELTKRIAIENDKHIRELKKIENEQDKFIREINYQQSRIIDLKRTIDEKDSLLRRKHDEYNALRNSYDMKCKDYMQLETNFYEHVRPIQATDDDLSTIHTKINQFLSQISNICLSIRSKMDVNQGTAFVLEQWPEEREAFERYLLVSEAPDKQNQEIAEKQDKNEENKVSLEEGNTEQTTLPESDSSSQTGQQPHSEGQETENTAKSVVTKPLDPGYITLFTERFINETIVTRVFEQPIHLGASINQAFAQMQGWLEDRNGEWATRFRQQVISLLVKNPKNEKEIIEQEKQALITEIIEGLERIYPAVKSDAKIATKVADLVTRSTNLNLAIKGQQVLVRVHHIEKGAKIPFDGTMMKPAPKGKQEGLVLFTIAPIFKAVDPEDPDCGFIIPAKVFNV